MSDIENPEIATQILELFCHTVHTALSIDGLPQYKKTQWNL
jgi:hypothetical protein